MRGVFIEKILFHILVMLDLETKSMLVVMEFQISIRDGSLYNFQ